MQTPPAPDAVTNARAALEKVRAALARNAETVARLRDDLAAMQRAATSAAADAMVEGTPAPKAPAALAVKESELALATAAAADLASREQIAVSALQNAACDWLSGEVRNAYASRAEAGKTAFAKVTEGLAELLKAQGAQSLEIVSRMLRDVPRRDYVGDSLSWVFPTASALGVASPLGANTSQLEAEAGFLSLADAAAAADQIARTAAN